MENFTQDVISLLQYLLPGFLTAWIFYGLTSHSKPSQFERILQALIFTLFIQVSANLVELCVNFLSRFVSFGLWGRAAEMICPIFIAVLFGFVFSYFVNTDKLHGYFRHRGITRESSFPSEWFGAFLDTTFVVLHLKESRRLYGWPKQWPSETTNGHFLIADPSWVDREGKESRITGVKAY